MGFNCSVLPTTYPLKHAYLPGLLVPTCKRDTVIPASLDQAKGSLSLCGGSMTGKALCSSSLHRLCGPGQPTSPPSLPGLPHKTVARLTGDPVREGVAGPKCDPETEAGGDQTQVAALVFFPPFVFLVPGAEKLTGKQ